MVCAESRPSLASRALLLIGLATLQRWSGKDLEKHSFGRKVGSPSLLTAFEVELRQLISSRSREDGQQYGPQHLAPSQYDQSEELLYRVSQAR